MLLGVRGLAAMWVFIGHLFISPVYDMGFVQTDTDSGLGWLHHILFFHFLAVDLFLMLSGCLLYIGYRDYFEQPNKSKDIDLFYFHRLARLYPLYILSVGIIGLYDYLHIPHPVFSGREDELFEHWELTLLLNALFMNAWGIVAAASWNEPSWTLSIIMLLYVVFPNIVVALKYAPTRPLPLMLLIYGLTLGYYIARQQIDGLSHSDGTGALMRGLVFFIVGCLLARMVQGGHWREARWDWYLPVILVINLALMILWHEAGWQFDMLWFHLLYPPFMLALFYVQGPATKLLGNRIIAFTGIISYGIYLLHYPLCLLIEYLLGDWLATQATGHALADSWIHISVTLSLCWISWLSYRYFENPANRYIKQLFPIKRGG